MHLLVEIDKTLFLFFNRTLANPIFDKVMVFITDKENFYIPILLTAILLIVLGGKKGRITILLVVIILILSDHLTSSLIKPLVKRYRPCHPDVLLEGGRFLLGHKSSFSFPSSHAANMVSMAVLFSVKYHRWIWFYITFAVLVSYSRIYVGVHYPCDVVMGGIMGGLCSMGVLFTEKKISHLIEAKKNNRKNNGEGLETIEKV